MANNKDEGLIVLATMFQFRDLADGGTSLTFHTQELSDTKFIQIRKMKQKFGILYFREGENQNIPDPIKEVEIDIHEKPKSPSQKLRNTLFRRWSVHYKTEYPTFDKYYNSVMNGLIRHYSNDPNGE